MLIAWSVTEVIRYSYFVVTLSGYNPGILVWLRYNTFFVLYPLGISSECWLIYKAIKPAKSLRQEYAWLLQLILFVYPPREYSPGCERRVLLMIRSLIHALYTHDGSKKEGYETEHQKGGIDARNCERSTVHIIIPFIIFVHKV